MIFENVKKMLNMFLYDHVPLNAFKLATVFDQTLPNSQLNCN